MKRDILGLTISPPSLRGGRRNPPPPPPGPRRPKKPGLDRVKKIGKEINCSQPILVQKLETKLILVKFRYVQFSSYKVISTNLRQGVERAL